MGRFILNIWDESVIYIEDAYAKHMRGDFEEAIDSWRHALSLCDNAYVRWNLAQALLSIGRYIEGFENYAMRWKAWPQMLNPGCAEILTRLPVWKGEFICGKTLVLLGEQGFGDVIMAARYIPVLQSMGIHVHLAVPSALHRLLKPLASINENGDLCCPFYDVPLYLQQCVDSVPNKPYLKVDPILRADWSIELHLDSPWRVGIAWATGPHDTEFNRNIPLAEFKALLDMPNATLYALQPNECELAVTHGVIVPQYTDFADVAAVASLMDMIVCADVAAIHVAGSIGHSNAHVLLPYLPSWRWASGNVWYPHVSCYQQKSPGDWASAFAQLKAVSEAA
jgi:hypothetical protein